jgi:serine protease Do
VKKVVNDLKKYGVVQRAYMGVTIREVDSKLMQEKKLDAADGVYIESVADNGGAKAAGIKEGDVITSIDNLPVKSNAELLEEIGQHSPGDFVNVTVDRDGKSMEFRVELKNQEGNTALAKKGDNFYMSDLGATLEQVPKEDLQSLKISNGLKVVDLQDGLLKKGGVQIGYIIQNINGTKIVSKDDVDRALSNVKNGVIRIEGIYPNGMRMNYGFIL